MVLQSSTMTNEGSLQIFIKSTNKARKTTKFALAWGIFSIFFEVSWLFLQVVFETHFQSFDFLSYCLNP
jgi:hypothetical protein